MRHVSASFNSITSYSTTKAYSVKFAELSKQNPEFATIESPNAGLPVRKVVMGDYHAVACDHAGAAFAWGENTAGQLGRGDIGATTVGDLSKPAIIEFGRGDETMPDAKASQRYLGQSADQNQRESTGDFKPIFRTRRFVFDVAAGGWQSGALVVDMRDYCATDSILPNISSSWKQEHSPSLSSKSEVGSVPPARPQRQWMSASQQVPHDSATESETTPDNSGNTTEDPSEPPRPAHGVPIRRGGLPFIRIGFAGRGGVRGGPGTIVPRP